MAQVLVVLPSLSNPPLPAEASVLAANIAKISNLDNRQTLCVRILAKMYQLTQNGGTNYKADYPLLIQSTANIFGNDFNISSAPYGAGPGAKLEAVLDWSAGYTATNTLPTNVQDLVNLMGILVAYPETTLMQVVNFLKYKLAE